MLSYHYLSYRNSNWNSNHWIINVKRPDRGTSYNDIVGRCVKMLSKVVGSEEAALNRIYIFWFSLPFGCCAEIDEEAAKKLRDMMDVLKVYPDYSFDIKKRNRYNNEAWVK